MPGLNDILISRFARYYAANDGWSHLEPVLDGGHLSDRDVDGCVNAAQMAGDVEGERLAVELLALSKVKRALVAVKAERAAEQVDVDG